MTNSEMAAMFDRIADMLEIKGENVHRILAYRNAANSIGQFPRDLRIVAAEGGLEEISGVGKVIAEKIAEILETGTLQFYENLAAEIPPGVVDILHINGVGPKKARMFWQGAGITDVPSLEAAAREGKLAGLPSMGAKSIARVLEGIESFNRRATDTRTPLGVALPTAERILAMIMQIEGVGKGAIAGSIRRALPTIGDVDLVVTAQDATMVMDIFVQMDEVARVLGHGPTKSSVELQNGLQVDLRVLPEEHWGTALVYFTGSKNHGIKLRTMALAKGLSLNEWAFTPVDGGEEILCATEEAVYSQIGLPYIPPEIREDMGEIEAAQKGKLPKLIQLSDIHADLHMHTVWSDGTATVQEMAEAALERGRKYIVITDHSHGATIANGLSIERLLEQQIEVRRVDAEMGGAIRVFHGTEMEIKADGTLDFPDEILEQLDFVIASLHVGLRQPRVQVTQRLLNALNNPNVDLIGHPRGQLIPERDPADLDMDAVFATAQKTGTALEINANPHRLDLEAQYARRAAEFGIPICIDTDAHRPETMDLMRYGVMTARRGWIEASQVINTWPLEQFMQWLDKRNGR
ncbi:MAG: DNA polymerase/3'-5' exonuclease PolX [Anaerolineae bacterium]|nr:DNA polymerase/3'-5' exonuclease PolX [Anaerolineae bacterium]